MTRDAPTWLSLQAYEQARDELSRLLLAHRAGRRPSHDGDPGPDDPSAWRELRIRRLQELLLTADVGMPPDDGIAEPGMVLTVGHSDRTGTETFLLADPGIPVGPDVAVCSARSPLGRVLLGARAGDTRSYPLPDGSTATVTLLSAEPFRD